MTTRRGIISLTATWAIPVFAVLTLGLGLSGWLDHGYRVGEAAYRSVALFDLGNGYYGDPPGSTDWRFKIARRTITPGPWRNTPAAPTTCWWPRMMMPAPWSWLGRRARPRPGRSSPF